MSEEQRIWTCCICGATGEAGPAHIGPHGRVWKEGDKGERIELGDLCQECCGKPIPRSKLRELGNV